MVTPSAAWCRWVNLYLSSLSRHHMVRAFYVASAFQIKPRRALPIIPCYTCFPGGDGAGGGWVRRPVAAAAAVSVHFSRRAGPVMPSRGALATRRVPPHHPPPPAASHHHPPPPPPPPATCISQRAINRDRK